MIKYIVIKYKKTITPKDSVMVNTVRVFESTRMFIVPYIINEQEVILNFQRNLKVYANLCLINNHEVSVFTCLVSSFL